MAKVSGLSAGSYYLPPEIADKVQKLSKVRDLSVPDSEALGEWSRPLISGKAPAARGGHTACIVGNLIVIFGGTYFDKKFQYVNDVQVIDIHDTCWHSPRCGGQAPGPRYGHSAVAIGTQVYVFGGKGPNGRLYNDMFCLDVEKWTWSVVPSATSPPLGRFGQAMVAVEDKIVVFGGWDGSVAFNDLWVYDLSSRAWIKPAVGGTPPQARHGHSLAVAPDGRLILFGGWAVDSKGHPVYLKDTRELDTASMTWASAKVSGDPPSPRYGHGTCVMGDFMVILGGWGPGQAKALETGEADDSAQEAAAAAARKAGRAVPHRSTWVLDMRTMRYIRPPLLGTGPSLLYGQSLTPVGPFALSYGGWDGVKPRGDVVQLDLSMLVGDLEIEYIGDDGEGEAKGGEEDGAALGGAGGGDASHGGIGGKGSSMDLGDGWDGDGPGASGSLGGSMHG